MALIVEDGTSKADSESYASIVNADAYVLNFYGVVTIWDTATDAVKEQALRQATKYIDNRYSFVGTRKTSTQSLDWPRYSSIDETDGKTIEDIPDVLINATAELALKVIQGTNLNPDTSVGGNVKKLKAGSVEKEFSEKRVNNQPIFHAVNDFLNIITVGSNRIIRS